MKEYIKMTEVLSSIGGVSNAIFFITCFINKIINEYTALKDIESILKCSNINIEETDKRKSLI